jgi:ectoine hydroxylase-related dioxygenase (phytanoyl-CoA dioxygenase family)
MPEPDWSALREAFRRDGVVFLPGALDRKTLDLARAAFDWTLAHPGPGASRFYGQGPATFYQDLANPEAPSAYATLLRDSPLADIAARLWGSDDVWFFYEQIFLKEGGETRRTPWHQDLPYLPIHGAELAVFWIAFDPVAKEDALEFVPGSHRGTLYNGSAFDPADDTAPIYPGNPLPRLPDIEADRAAWPIVSWAVEPGDVLAFHPAILHGGAATRPGGCRRTLSLRLFGADAAYVPRPHADGMPEFTFTRIGEVLKPGDPFRSHPRFTKLRPSGPHLRASAASPPAR